VNIERLRGNETPQGFSGRVEFELSSSSGNVDLQTIDLSVRTDYLGRTNLVFLLLQGDVGWESGDRFQDEGLIHLRFTRQAHELVWPELFTQFDFNHSRLLALRALVGGGLRVRLIRGDEVQVALGTAYMLEHERLDREEGAAQGNEVTVHRWSSYLSMTGAFGEGLGGSLTAYVQPRLDALGDTRILTEAQLSADILGPISVTLSFRLRYDSEPPADTDALDTELTTGFVVRW